MSVQYKDDSRRVSGRFAMIMKAEYAYLVEHTTFAGLAMFTHIALHVDKFGVTQASKAYLIRTSGLPQSTAYYGFTKLLELGIISNDLDGGYLINPLDEWHYSGQVELIQDSSSIKVDSMPLRTYPCTNKLDNNDEGADMTRVSNVSRNTPPLGRSRNPPHGRSSSKPTQSSPNKAAAVDVASSKIHELSGVWISDSHKFDTATPHLTREEWLPFILEAWELKDVLQSEKYPEFNAAKVINYAKHRAAYRKKMPKTGPTTFDYSAEVTRLLEVNDVRRFQELQNYVMCGLPRGCLQGRISSEELAQLYPQAEGPVDPGQSEHPADLHPARL